MMEKLKVKVPTQTRGIEINLDENTSSLNSSKWNWK